MKRHACYRQKRRGSMMVLALMAIVILVLMAALCIDVSYMQLTRSELQAASDAASRAATEALSRGRSQTEVRKIAHEIARKNLVAGAEFKINDADVVFGTAAPDSSGKYVFEAGGTNPNAVQVIGSQTEDSAAGSVKLFLGRILGRGTFEPTLPANSAEREREICVVLPKPPPPPPRPVSYPTSYPTSYPSSYPTYYPTSYPQSYPTPQPSHCPTKARPTPPGSNQNEMPVFFASFRMQQSGQFSSDTLRPYLQTFVDSLQLTPAAEQVALVSYASTATTQLELTKALAQLPIAAGSVQGQNGRAIGTGLEMGIEVVSNATRARRHAQRIVVLLVDDVNSSGPAPESLIATAVDNKVVVHVIAIAGVTNTAGLRALAEGTGGKLYEVTGVSDVEKNLAVIGVSPPITMFE